MDKSIDLGKLQSELESAKKALRNAEARNGRAFISMTKAQANYDESRAAVKNAREAIDTLAYKVVQATRSVVTD